MNLADIIYWINVFFLFYMFLYSVIFFLTTLFSSISADDFSSRKDFTKETFLDNNVNYIPISIVVPAHNEAKTIINAVESLTKLDYPLYEIVIVNDGSKDDTLNVVLNHFHLKKVYKPSLKLVPSKAPHAIYQNDNRIRVTLVDKDQGGKSDALNSGINFSQFPLFLCVDADSILKKDALRKIIQPFLEDDKMVAIGGNVKVSNGMKIVNGEVVSYKSPKKAIVKFQKVEYLRVFLNSRISLDSINGNLIISGAFGLYQKQAVVNVGGYTNDLMGEDMEIIVKIHSYYRKNELEYNTAYVPNAICYTQVPEKVSVLKKQRRRWHIGLAQSLKIHQYMLLNPKYGVIGMVSFPYFYFFEFLSPFMEVFGLVTITASFILRLINTEFFIFYLLVYIGYNSLISLISIMTDRYLFHDEQNSKDIKSLYLYSLLEAFGYRQMISIFRIGSMFGRKNKITWGDMERTES